MTDRIRHTGPAIFYASAAAGPIAIATLALAQLMSGKPLSVRMSPDLVWGAIGGGGVFSVIAMLVALLPNTVGVTVMGWVASRNVGLRHPAAWALTGAAATGLPAWLAVICDPGHAWVAGWAAVGAMSALVCRWAIWWEESTAG